MTEEYKSLILKYLTGQLSQQTGNNIPTFSEINSKTNNLYTFCSENFSTYFTIVDVIQSTVSSNFVVWGNDWDDTTLKTNSKIIILDENFNIVQKIEEYSSGVQFGEFIDLQVDSSGEFYLLEKFNNSYRFVMLNNILAKLSDETDYHVDIRKSYEIPSTYQNNEFRDITKSLNNSYYCFTGVGIPNTKVIALELRVNVGSENEWNFYTSETVDFILSSKGTAFWDSQSNINIKLGASVGDMSGTNYYEFYNYNDALSFNVFDTTIHGDVLDFALLSSDLGYISVKDSFGYYGNYETNHIYKIDYESKSLIDIYSVKCDLDLPTQIGGITFFKTDNYQLFFKNIYPITSDREGNYNVIIGKIISNNCYTKDLTTMQFTAIQQSFLFVQRIYDLYKIAFQKENSVLYTDQIYNEFNYNGNTYENTNSLKPNHVVLYNNNDEILFSRNLYNLTLNNNSYTATVEIPNQYLNDGTISKQSLIGETNYELIENSEIITKNIYEKLLINFQNTITIFEDTIQNLTNSIKLNNSINQTLDYDNTKMTKYRINYKEYNSNTYWNGDSTIYWNGSSEEIWEETTTIKDLPTPTIINNLATYIININTAQGINTIEFLSNDETTVYRTIDLSSYEKNKNLEITQEVEVI